jgi:hypothetical protein
MTQNTGRAFQVLLIWIAMTRIVLMTIRVYRILELIALLNILVKVCLGFRAKVSHPVKIERISFSRKRGQKKSPPV